MATFDDFFTSLLYGVGWPFGLIIIMVVIVFLTLVWEFGIAISLPVSVLLAVAYIQHQMQWQAVSMFAVIGLCLFTASKGMKGKKR